MIKKALVVLGVLLVGGWLWAKTDLGSYAKTAWKNLRASVKRQVPVEFDIQRARDMLASLDGEADKLIGVMAEEMAGIEKGEKEITDLQAAVARQEEIIRDMNTRLKTEGSVITVGGTQRSRDRFAADLERKFTNFKLAQGTLESKKESLEYRRQNLDAAKEQLEALRAKKAELHARIERVETELRKVQADEAWANRCGKFDDTQLAKVKDLVEELETAVKTRKYEVKLRGEDRTIVTAPTPSVSPADLTQEIDSHLGSKTVAEKK